MARRIIPLFLVPTVIVSACDSPSTSVGTAVADPAFGVDLELRFPELTPELLMASSSESSAAAPRGPAASDGVDDELYSPEALDTAVEDLVSGIYAAKTVPGFEPGYGYARGENWYSGNKGRVETTTDVSYEGQPLGSQSAFSEGYELFLLDFGRWKFLSATARVYSGRECGLSVQGRSEHTAWWEFFTGVGVSTWGKTGQTTASSPVSQEPCAQEVTGGEWGDGTSSSSAFACWYLLTYDLESGDVFDAELLYCDQVDDWE